MTTLVNTVVTAVVAALKAAPAVCTQVDRVRLRALPQGTGLAVAVRPLVAQVAQADFVPGVPILWHTDIAIECYARSTATTAPDVAVDALVQAVYERLMADPTLAGVVLNLQPTSVAYEFDADAEQTTCAILSLTARQRCGAATFT